MYMLKHWKKVVERYFSAFEEKGFGWFYLISIIVLFASLFVNYYASVYATESMSNAVTDVILSNIRIYDVDSIFVYGPFVLWICVTLFLIIHPNKVPFTLKSVTLFILIRSVFISLTHIGPFPTGVTVEAIPNLIKYFTAGGDLFFSAHTGLPFLLALIFWKHWLPRVSLIITSVFFGVIVLMGHYHYTIDVVAAFFITYSIYKMSVYLFKRDYGYFQKSSGGIIPPDHAL